MGRIRQGYQKKKQACWVIFFQWLCQVTAKAFWDWRDTCWTRLKGVTAFWEKLLTVPQLLIPVITLFGGICDYFNLFLSKHFRWHLKSSTCTSWSTTYGGATTVERWRKPWGLDFGGPRSNGPTTWASAQFSSGWWTNARVIPTWHLRWLTPWLRPFWMGFSETTLCFWYYMPTKRVRVFFVPVCCIRLLATIRTLRDYGQDLDAILLAKPQRFTPEMTAMWQDHVGRAMLRPQGSLKDDDSEVLDQVQDTRQKQFDFCLLHFERTCFCSCWLCCVELLLIFKKDHWLNPGGSVAKRWVWGRSCKPESWLQRSCIIQPEEEQGSLLPKPIPNK